MRHAATATWLRGRCTVGEPQSAGFLSVRAETVILRGYAEGWQPDTAGHPGAAGAGTRSERADSPEPG